MKRKIAFISIGIVLVIIIAVGVLLIPKGDYKYQVNEDNTITLTKYTGHDKDVIIPDTIRGKKVTTIGELCFCFNTEIESVTIPDTVEVIGLNAFSDTTITKVIGGKNIRELGRGAFGACKSLEHITLYEKVESIGREAFMSSGLKTISINSDLKSIGETAFMNTYLEEIEIPDTVEVIGSNAFADTPWEDTWPDDEFTIVGDGVLLKYPVNQKQVIISEGVKVISTHDWKNMELNEIYLPRTTTTIVEEIFIESGEIKMYVPSSVETIGGIGDIDNTDIYYKEMDKLTLVVESGSYAEEYAKAKAEETGLKYEVVDKIEYPEN